MAQALNYFLLIKTNFIKIRPVIIISWTIEDNLLFAKLEELVHLANLAERSQPILVCEWSDAKVVVRVFLVDFIEQLDLVACSVLCLELNKLK